MKHNLKITIIIAVLFLVSQLMGLKIVASYISPAGEWANLPYDIERPEVREEIGAFQIIFTLLFATFLALILIKLKARRLWTLWFFLSVWFTLLIAFGAFINQTLALVLGLILAVLKTFKRNIIVHNFTELFIYGGLAAVFVPILNLLSILILLGLISVYDFIAVFKTKHMIKLAKFQAKMKLFAGLLIPYAKNKAAILGGGDMGFPLLFTGVIYKLYGIKALIIPFTVTIALLFLLVKSKKNKYYPAMPILSAGCLIGLLLVVLI